MKRLASPYFWIYALIWLFLLREGAVLATPADSATGLQVESIEIVGNQRTRPQVIYRLLDFAPGDYLNRTRLEQNRLRLQESNFFKKVNLYTQPGSQRGKIRVYVEVQERHWPYFQFRGGYSQLDGWYISPIGLRADNLFGYGHSMGVEFLIGDRLGALEAFYLHPDIFSSDMDFELSFFTRSREFLHYFDDERFHQKVKTGGLSLRLNGRSGLMKYLWLEFELKQATADSFLFQSGEPEQLPLPQVLLPDSGSRNISRVIISLRQDTRNHLIYPTSGWWGSLSFMQISKQFGAFTDYHKIILDIRGYQELLGGWVIAGRLNVSVADTSAPFYDRFYLGGPNSLRGYPDRSLTPAGYASRLVLSSVELRFPITRKHFPRQFLTGVFFYDTGQAWNPPVQFDWNSFRSSVGFGLRFLIPFIGVVRTDFAYPLPDMEFQFHLSLGHTF